jgi:hypothetical protein
VGEGTGNFPYHETDERIDVYWATTEELWNKNVSAVSQLTWVIFSHWSGSVSALERRKLGSMVMCDFLSLGRCMDMRGCCTIMSTKRDLPLIGGSESVLWRVY